MNETKPLTQRTMTYPDYGAIARRWDKMADLYHKPSYHTMAAATRAEQEAERLRAEAEALRDLYGD